MVAPITIEEKCWIAATAFIGPGVTIGKGSVVAAGSVVMRDAPPNSFVRGNPAEVKERRDQQSEVRDQ
jgi:acetyltransferase-like isoleucine patch superfamily enzyme